MVGLLEGFADVWGVSYLMTLYLIPKSEAAELISFIFLGMLFGGPILTLAAAYFGNYKVISICGIGMAAVFVKLILFSANYNWYLIASLFLCIGIMCCYQVIIFAVGAELVSEKMLGVTIFLNYINMFRGSFFHSLIGKIMDMFWTGTIQMVYANIVIESYQHALMVIPICSVIGAIIIIFVRINLARNIENQSFQSSL